MNGFVSTIDIRPQNPSVVGTANEPQRGCDFQTYFDYYQNRAASEAENIRMAREQNLLLPMDNRITIPTRHWTMCHNLASVLIEGGTQRWEQYVLMEAIHCFYNTVADLTPDEATAVADRCFERHTKNILMKLKPNKMILLGNQPYELFKQHLEREIDNYDFCALTLNNLRIPVLRHPHPAGFSAGPFYRPNIYSALNLYCNDFDYGD